MTHIPITFASKRQKKIAVISHERSGTHFLMNTLALNFNYMVTPWLNYDYELGLNLYAPQHILEYLRYMHDKPVLNILKSHHPLPFFVDNINYFTDQFHVFYIYRDPRDVMVSFWKLIKSLDWDEGPNTETIGEFIRSAPCGAILRYQKKQEETMLHRWKNHVEGWVNLSRQSRENKIMIISYEDLNLEFEKTLRGIGEYLEKPVMRIRRPKINKNVVGAGEGIVESYKGIFTNADDEYLRNILSQTMKDLGYV